MQTIKPWAISLSGGGLSCLAYLGFIDELQQLGFAPSYYGGLSGGAIVAALLASKVSLDEARQILIEVNSPAIINRHFRNLEIIDHHKLIESIRAALPIKNFENLHFPLAVFATDLRKKEAVMINTGDIASAVVASSSVFPLFQPVKRKGFLLGDGGFTVYYGAQYLREMGAKKVVGVDVTGLTEGRIQGFFAALYAQINASISSNAKYELQLHPVDLDVKISFQSPTMFDVNQKANHIIDLGRRIAHKNSAALKKTLGN